MSKHAAAQRAAISLNVSSVKTFEGWLLDDLRRLIFRFDMILRFAEF
jgi:hypothetical protein